MKSCAWCLLVLCHAWWAGCAASDDVPLLLVVSFDGFWYQYLSLYNTPNIQALAAEGVRAEYMKNVYVTKTFPNHFTLATGLYEESHGIMGNSMYDPALNETFDLSNTDPRWWDNGQVVPIWIANQLHGTSRRSGGMMWPGTDVTFHNGRAHRVLAYDPRVNFTTRVDTVISWFLDSAEPVNCVLLYHEEPDATGHRFGPFSTEVRTQVEAVDNLVGQMVQSLAAAGLLDRLNLLLVSDHGMASVPSANVIDVDAILGADAYLEYGTSPVWNLVPRGGHTAEELHSKLAQASSRGVRLRAYLAADIPAEYHYAGNARALSVLLEANEGWELVRGNPGPRDNRTVYGAHGYNNSLDSMHPLFVGRGPDLVRGLVVGPFPNVDLFPLMCVLLRLPVLPSNGSLDHVVSMLRLAGTPQDRQVVPVVFLVALGVLSATTLVALTALGFQLWKGRGRKQIREVALAWSRPEEQAQLLVAEDL
ncbi:bis(5'-adenosyl)-triphosphatase ENPP4 [Ixodes scapularis]